MRCSHGTDNVEGDGTDETDEHPVADSHHQGYGDQTAETGRERDAHRRYTQNRERDLLHPYSADPGKVGHLPEHNPTQTGCDTHAHDQQAAV